MKNLDFLYESGGSSMNQSRLALSAWMRLEQATNLCQQVNNQSSQFQMNVSFSIFAIGVIHNARTGYTTAEYYIYIFKVSNGLIKVI